MMSQVPPKESHASDEDVRPEPKGMEPLSEEALADIVGGDPDPSGIPGLA